MDMSIARRTFATGIGAAALGGAAAAIAAPASAAPVRADGDSARPLIGRSRDRLHVMSLNIRQDTTPRQNQGTRIIGRTVKPGADRSAGP